MGLCTWQITLFSLPLSVFYAGAYVYCSAKLFPVMIPNSKISLNVMQKNPPCLLTVGITIKAIAA